MFADDRIDLSKFSTHLDSVRAASCKRGRKQMHNVGLF